MTIEVFSAHLCLTTITIYLCPTAAAWPDLKARGPSGRPERQRRVPAEVKEREHKPLDKVLTQCSYYKRWLARLCELYSCLSQTGRVWGTTETEWTHEWEDSQRVKGQTKYHSGMLMDYIVYMQILMYMWYPDVSWGKGGTYMFLPPPEINIYDAQSYSKGL